MRAKMWFQLGCWSAASAVVFGAFGAHWLKSRVSEKRLLDVWETAALYQFIHSFGLIAVGLSRNSPPLAGWSFIAGITLFSGSLYTLALTNQPKLGMITPIGGLSFIVGWAALALKGM